MTIPEQTPEFLTKSPRGKVPVLGTPQGSSTRRWRSSQYLEDLGQGKPLMPKDPYERALVRAYMKEIELYIELPARSCFAEAFFGGKLPDAIKTKARDDLKAGFAALKRHARFAPYVRATASRWRTSSSCTASIWLLRSASRCSAWTWLSEIPAGAALLQRLGQNPNVQEFAARRDAGMAGFIAAMRAKVQAPA